HRLRWNAGTERLCAADASQMPFQAVAQEVPDPLLRLGSCTLISLGNIHREQHTHPEWLKLAAMRLDHINEASCRRFRCRAVHTRGKKIAKAAFRGLLHGFDRQ